MAGIRLEWAQFGDFDSFDVIRSDTSIANVADEGLPSPIATNLKTMYYVDTTVIAGNTYYYKVRAWRDSVTVVSDEIKASAGNDAYWVNVVTLLNFKNNIVDEKGRTWTSQSTTVFNDNCLQLTGNSLSTRYSNDFDWIDDSYTIECFVKADSWATWSVPGTISGIPILIGRMDQTGDSNQWSFGVISSGKVRFYYFMSGQKILVESTVTIPLDELTHISFCKTLTRAYVSVNGVVSSANIPAITLQNVNTNISVGRYNGASITGQLGAVRITKGVARYTENFTPPAAPFPATS